jgi:hypothetical protein
MENTTEITASKTIKTLRRYASKVGLKTTSQDGVKIRFNNGFIYYKQSSENVSFGITRKDWIEDSNGNIIVDPIQIKHFQLPKVIDIHTDTYVIQLENHGEFFVEEDLVKETNHEYEMKNESNK